MLVPGPGTYIPPALVGKEGRKVTMGATNKYDPGRLEQSYKPGPGQYSPLSSATSLKSPGYKIGSGSRKDLASEKQRSF